MQKFTKSKKYKILSHQLIPGGAHTYSKGDDQFPIDSPGFIEKGNGCWVWDIDGNKFLDWGMALRSISIGYCNKKIDKMVIKELKKGINFTRPSLKEIKLAELLKKIIPSAEMVKFCKNGSDATSAAVRLSRAYTKKNLILRCLDQPFFSVGDWFIGNTVVNSGIPDSIKKLTKYFKYNDINFLKKIINKYKNNIACIILEPASTEEPKRKFLQQIRKICTEKKIVLIFDEIITGFRWHLSGAQKYYNVKPDLSTFGKSIANGYPLSVLVGKRKIMKLGGIKHKERKVFLLSSTYGAETLSLTAALETIKILKKNNIIIRNWKLGKKLKEDGNKIFKKNKIYDYIKISGISISPYIIFKNSFCYEKCKLKKLCNKNLCLKTKTFFLEEMIKQNILIPYISFSASHTINEVNYTLKAFNEFAKKFREKLSTNSQFINNDIKSKETVMPVFREYN